MSDLTNAEFSAETISSVTTKPPDPYQCWSFHIYKCGRCVSFSIILVEFKGTELRLKRHVFASAPTCLWCKWLHSSVWRTNSIMHSWAVRASLLLLLEATCSPCYHTNSSQQEKFGDRLHRGKWTIPSTRVWTLFLFTLNHFFSPGVMCMNSKGCWERGDTLLQGHTPAKCYKKAVTKSTNLLTSWDELLLRET